MLYQFFIDANDKDNKISARGLMLLFGIGIIPIVLGVDVTALNISIPWLIDVSVKHKDRFALIYALLLLYSVYRFRLSNKEIQRHCRLNSMGLFMQDQVFGRIFVHRYIFNRKIESTVYFDQKQVDQEISVYCKYDDEPYEPTDVFNISLDLDNNWVFQLKMLRESNFDFLGISKLWGVQYNSFCDPFDGTHNVSERKKINDLVLRTHIRFFVFLFSIKASARDITCLDYYLPIYCNVGLSIFLVLSFFFSM